MAKDLTNYQRKIVDRYYEHRDTIMLDKLGQIVSDLYLADSPAKVDKLWKSAALALEKTAANNVAARKVLDERSIEGLARLISELSVPGKQPAAAPAPAPAPVAVPATDASAPIDPEVLKAAMRAFRKRLKLTKLDEESKLGRSPLSGGQKSAVVAIVPPRDYPTAVWEALADEGKLKRSGRGFYELGPKA